MVQMIIDLWPIITAIVGLIAAAGVNQYKVKELSSKDVDKEKRLRELEINSAEMRVGIAHVVKTVDEVHSKVDQILSSGR